MPIKVTTIDIFSWRTMRFVLLVSQYGEHAIVNCEHIKKLKSLVITGEVKGLGGEAVQSLESDTCEEKDLRSSHLESWVCNPSAGKVARTILATGLVTSFAMISERLCLKNKSGACSRTAPDFDLWVPNANNFIRVHPHQPRPSPHRSGKPEGLQTILWGNNPSTGIKEKVAALL